jgi:hypothetical protein
MGLFEPEKAYQYREGVPKKERVMFQYDWVRKITSIVFLAAWFCPASLFAAKDPTTVATFHCIGLYWNTDDGSSDNTCQVRYRRVGSNEWARALPLWFDARGPQAFRSMFQADEHSRQPPKVRSLQYLSHQYRGSIGNLSSGTTYEIELRLEKTNRISVLRAQTWSEDFPISKTIYVTDKSGTLLVDQSGSPNGYILYTHPENSKTATIDVANERDQCVEVRASYVVIRGLTLKHAKAHGIRIFDGSHDVVIERCDISGWGRPDKLEPDKWGYNTDSAIYARESDPLNPTISRIIVQRCRMHHPRCDTNSWSEYRKSADPDRTDTRWHPGGPQAITLVNTGGNHVIRYNDVWSDEDHYYNDIFGGGSNFSAAGSPNCDSDIYCNRFEQCWDDGIEAEGANCNVRIWGNYISHTMVSIATAATHVGPLYIWRNVSGTSQCKPLDQHGGPFLKAGLGRGFGGGRTYIFHNTFLQPPALKTDSQGVSVGLSSWGGGIINHISRNNILHVYGQTSASIEERSGVSRDNDFDYDLYNGRIKATGQQETHGIKGTPIYDSRNRPGQFALDQNSPGYDAGIVIANFNDNFTGKAPDIGAHEAGTPPMQFGTNAYRHEKQ